MKEDAELAGRIVEVHQDCARINVRLAYLREILEAVPTGDGRTV